MRFYRQILSLVAINTPRTIGSWAITYTTLARLYPDELQSHRTRDEVRAAVNRLIAIGRLALSGCDVYVPTTRQSKLFDEDGATQ